MKTFIINLKESVDRRKHILKEVSAFPFLDIELIEAVNGRKMSPKEIEDQFDCERFGWRYRRMPMPGEIGCTLSHRVCYHKLLHSEESYAFILEDDASFIDLDNVYEIVNEGAKWIEAGKADIVLFVTQMLSYKKPKPFLDSYKAYSVYAAYSTCSYLIGRKGAKELLKHKRPSIVADDFEWMNRQGLRIVNIYPNILVGFSSQQKFESVIEEGRKIDCTIQLPFKYRILRSIHHHFRKVLLKTGMLERFNGFE